MSPFWTVSLFWIAAVACVAAALAFVLPALVRGRGAEDKGVRRDVNIAVYRDQLKEMDADRANGLLSEEQYAHARQELEVRLADDALAPEAGPARGHAGNRRLGFALAVMLPVAAFALYFWLGNPAALVPAASAPGAAMAGTGEDFEQLIRQVEEKTRANPADGEAWTVLARSYAFVERWPKALEAFEKAATLLPQEASVLSGLAEAQALSGGGVMTARSMGLVQQALALDPNDAKGLELAGVHAFQQQDFATSAAYFGRLYALLPPDEPYAQGILAAQREAGRRAGPDAAAVPAPSGEVATPNAVIRGRVDIAPALESALRESDVLFLFARPIGGGPPVAAIRASAGELPLTFELGDDAAMNPDNALSRHSQVTLVARVSRSGDPMGQAGDLEGSAAEVRVGAGDVVVVIDRIRP